MKLLRILASNYKNCCDDFTIDLVAKSKKTSEDKEYELQEIADELFVYNTAAIVGKNASGKTSAIELMRSCYSILSEFRLENMHYNYDNVRLELIFYHEGNIYKYNTVLKSDPNLGSKANFTEQHLYCKKYYKTNVKCIYSDKGFEEITGLGELPEDTSIVFFVLKRKTVRAVYFNCDGEGPDTYRLMFRAMKTYGISKEVLTKVIRIFDDNINSLDMIDDNRYKLIYQNIHAFPVQKTVAVGGSSSAAYRLAEACIIVNARYNTAVVLLRNRFCIGFVFDKSSAVKAVLQCHSLFAFVRQPK